MGAPNFIQRISGYVATTAIVAMTSAFSNVNPLAAQPNTPDPNATPVTGVQELLAQPTSDELSDGTENNIPQPAEQTDALSIDPRRETPVQELESAVDAAAEAAENAEQQTTKQEDQKPAEEKSSAIKYIEDKAAELARNLEQKRKLEDHTTALNTSNLKQVTQIGNDARSTANASGFNLSLDNLNPKVSVGQSMQVGDGSIGALLETGINGTNARVAYENGKFVTTAETGSKGNKLNVAYELLQPSPTSLKFDPATIGRQADTYAKQNLQPVDMAAILNTAFNVQGQR